VLGLSFTKWNGPKDRQKSEDQENIIVAGKGPQELIERQLLLDAETNRIHAARTLVGLAAGEGFYCNEIKGTG